MSNQDSIAAAGKLRTALNKSRKSFEASVSSARERHRERCADLISKAGTEAFKIVAQTEDGQALLKEIKWDPLPK